MVAVILMVIRRFQRIYQSNCHFHLGMIYMRGQANDYNSWAQACNDPSWNWNSILKYFKKHEDSHQSDTEFHSAGGPWTVEKQRLKWDVLDVFQKAAVEYGIPITTDFNRYGIFFQIVLLCNYFLS